MNIPENTIWIDKMEAQWRKDAIRSIIDGINAEGAFQGESGKYVLEIKRLDFADFAAGDIGIEFKEPGDFINSIRDKRLFDQAMGMRMNFANPRIVVNCGYHDLFTPDIIGNFHPNAIRGLIPSLIFNYKVEVDFTGGRGHDAFKTYMSFYLRKALGGRTIVPHLPVRPSADPKDHMRAIISGFPGIGEKKVDQVMSKYKSLKEFIDNPGRMIHTRGWGNGTIRKIEAVINNERNEWWDSEADTEDELPKKDEIRGIPVTKMTQKYVEKSSAWTTGADEKDKLRY